jgi:hypothetical protein
MAIWGICVELRCAACGASVPVRRYDPERGAPTVELAAPGTPADHDVDARPQARAVSPSLPPLTLPWPTLLDRSATTADLTAPLSGCTPAPQEEVSQPPFTERRRDNGNVVRVACRHCGKLTSLDPTRMAKQTIGVVLRCAWCYKQFLVRHLDVERPAPNAALGSLHTNEPAAAQAFTAWLSESLPGGPPHPGSAGVPDGSTRKDEP